MCTIHLRMMKLERQRQVIPKVEIFSCISYTAIFFDIHSQTTRKGRQFYFYFIAISYKMDDLLNYMIDHDMMGTLSYVREQIEMKKKKDILKKYGGCIWHNEKENVWYCYLPDNTLPSGRKRYKRRKRMVLKL